MSAERDVAHWLEARPLDREYATSTVVFPSPLDKHVTAKVLANQTELVASITREALAQHRGSEIADSHEHEGAF